MRQRHYVSRVGLLAAFMVVLSLGATVPVLSVETQAQITRPRLDSPIARIAYDTTVSSRTARPILRALNQVGPAIESDFGTSMTTVSLRIYGTHASFGRELRGLQRVEPEGSGDNMGNVVGGILPMGPGVRYLRHTLAHVYTEWVMDKLNRNVSDREPSPAWLYDGLAEYVANQVSRPMYCRLRGRTLISLRELSQPTSWWRIRATPLQGAEYCEAERAAAQIVRARGWGRLVRLLHRSRSWAEFAQVVGRPIQG